MVLARARAAKDAFQILIFVIKRTAAFLPEIA